MKCVEIPFSLYKNLFFYCILNCNVFHFFFLTFSKSRFNCIALQKYIRPFLKPIVLSVPLRLQTLPFLVSHLTAYKHHVHNHNYHFPPTPRLRFKFCIDSDPVHFCADSSTFLWLQTYRFWFKLTYQFHQINIVVDRSVTFQHQKMTWSKVLDPFF